VSEPRVTGVLVDLDDTLYPQASWLAGAWRAVSAAAAPAVDAQDLEAALVEVASAGSDRGRIIDRALVAVGHDATARVELAALVAAFRAYRAPALACYAGTRAALAALRAHVPVALVSDGDPHIQRGKIDALGLGDAFDAIVLSDELGREFRKPHAAPFAAAVARIGRPAHECVMIGDRPDKDVAGACAAGMLGAVRVRTGEYHAAVSDGALAEADDFAGAVAWLQPAFGESGATPADAERQREQRGDEPRVPREPVSR
jgi:putative hydrolase of the HAD superfamily